MYAVIRSGGKQYRVETGQRLEVERLKADDGPVGEGAEVDLAPVLLVDGDRVLARPDDLQQARVRARVVGDTRGKKIRGFTYKPKSNNRRRWGHRQHHSVIEITEITPGGSAKSQRSASKATSAKDADVASPDAPTGQAEEA
jgi:large subunit ribosomal protein L21